eukprot:scaffold4409_cov369-Prasinococcus_capsulatus_cf.AAC.16
MDNSSYANQRRRSPPGGAATLAGGLPASPFAGACSALVLGTLALPPLPPQRGFRLRALLTGFSETAPGPALLKLPPKSTSGESMERPSTVSTRAIANVSSTCATNKVVSWPYPEPNHSASPCRRAAPGVGPERRHAASERRRGCCVGSHAGARSGACSAGRRRAAGSHCTAWRCPPRSPSSLGTRTTARPPPR